ncbi:MAG: phospholipid carrier-dependent glycosyltransferase [Dehalococcoidales bacterium]|nr:phospholipid carrier-dependent glycosyltransferase [Dehalococcoidales bacterium]
MKDFFVHILGNRTFQVIFLVYSSLLVFLGRQLDRGITNFDDAYYAQKAKEIFLSDSLWVVLWRNSPIFDNPPLPFWLTGLAYKVFGVSGYAAVFSSAVFGALTIYLTYSLCNYLFKDNWTAFLAAFVLLFPGMFVDSSRRGMLDITLTFFITAAMYGLIKGLKDKKFYLLYGVMTGCAVLTKSVLGFFPIVIGVVFMFWHGGFKKLFDFGYLAGVSVAILVGCSWYAVNWYVFGEAFIKLHFNDGHMKLVQDSYFGGNLLYLLGYFKDMAKNYWPWLPVTAAGVFLFAKRSFREKDVNSMFLFLWVSMPFLVMSTSRNQTLRYLFMIFPALAMITSHTIAGWLKEVHKEKTLPWMFGIVMATVLVVNVTPAQVKVSLTYNSAGVRDIASLIHVNTPENQMVNFYKLTSWNPTHALMFYSNRFLGDLVKNPEDLFGRIKKDRRKTWLSSVSDFRDLEKDFPGRLYLIYANREFAYFTSQENRENVVYDFSDTDLPVIR